MTERARCRECEFLNWEYDTNDHSPGTWFCGLHGRARVDPDEPQPDLNHKGGCGFIKAKMPRQYKLF